MVAGASVAKHVLGLHQEVTARASMGHGDAVVRLDKAIDRN
jgi:hypothetical protein